jgi:hypothetical protein
MSKKVSQSLAKLASKLVTCSICLVQVRADRLQAHGRRVHPELFATCTQDADVESNNRTIGSETRLRARSNSPLAGPEANPLLAAKSAVEPGASPEQAKCPNCLRLLKASRMASHIKDRCPNTAKQLLKQNAPRKRNWSEVKFEAALESAAKQERAGIRRAFQGGLPQ